MLKLILHCEPLELADITVGALGVANVTGQERKLLLLTSLMAESLTPLIQGRACPLVLPAAM